MLADSRPQHIKELVMDPPGKQVTIHFSKCRRKRVRVMAEHAAVMIDTVIDTLDILRDGTLKNSQWIDAVRLNDLPLNLDMDD